MITKMEAPGRYLFTDNFTRGRKYIEKFILKNYGKHANASLSIFKGNVVCWFTDDPAKWFKIIMFDKNCQVEIPEWNEVWIDKKLDKRVIKELILPKAKGQYKIHWVRF